MPHRGFQGNIGTLQIIDKPQLCDRLFNLVWQFVAPKRHGAIMALKRINELLPTVLGSKSFLSRCGGMPLREHNAQLPKYRKIRKINLDKPGWVVTLLLSYEGIAEPYYSQFVIRH
jgi:hypothetical protein